MTAVTVTTRATKGSRLTHAEMDQNFTTLRDAANSRAAGSLTATSDGSGAISISHGLSGVPVSAIVQRLGAANYPRPAVVAVDGVHISVVLVDSSSNPVASTSATLHWQASL